MDTIQHRSTKHGSSTTGYAKHKLNRVCRQVTLGTPPTRYALIKKTIPPFWFPHHKSTRFNKSSNSINYQHQQSLQSAEKIKFQCFQDKNAAKNNSYCSTRNTSHLNKKQRQQPSTKPKSPGYCSSSSSGLWAKKQQQRKPKQSHTTLGHSSTHLPAPTHQTHTHPKAKTNSPNKPHPCHPCKKKIIPPANTTLFHPPNTTTTHTHLTRHTYTTPRFTHTQKLFKTS